jgi:nitrite reductase/ring-hydroxylating ferredoxin subunit
MSETTTDMGHASRRAVLAGAAGAAAGAAGLGAAAALAGCGSDKPSTSSGASTAGGIKKGDIPEGGGKVYGDDKIVVTQPTAGTYKAFTAVCTHQGCILADVSGGTINCTCHGSKFSIADGSVKEAANGDKENKLGQKGLTEKTVTVDGDNLKIS